MKGLKILSEQRNYKIDNIRGIAILLVVFGHSIILYSSSWNLYTSTIQAPILDYVKQVINLIQMPLFFSLSGFLFLNSLRKNIDLIDILKTKIQRLLVPFMFFSILWLLPIRLLVKYPGYLENSIMSIIWNKIILGYDNGHMWYLPTLLLCFIVSGILYKFIFGFIDEEKRSVLIYLTSLILYLFGLMVNLQPYIKNLCIWYFYFAFGILLKQFEEKWMRTNKLYKWLLMILTITVTTIEIKNYNILMQLGGAICWVLLLYIVVGNKKNVILSKLSEYSFGIYLFHSPLVYITYTYMSDSSPILVIFINFIVYGVFSYAVTEKIKKSRLKWIIGEKSK